MELQTVKSLTHVDQFLQSFISKNTRTCYERDLKEYADFSKASDPLEFSTLLQYRDHLISKSAPSTVVRKLSSVKSFFSFMAGQGVIRHNPADNLTLPKSRTVKSTEAFEDSEAVRVMNAPDVSGLEGSTHRLALVLLFNLGLRRSELTRLRLKDLGEHRGSHFLTIEGKGQKQRLVPITGSVLQEINAHLLRYAGFTGKILNPSDFLIQTDRYAKSEKPADSSTVYRWVRIYAKAAGVTRRVSPHSCRATLISHLLEKDVSPRSVADLVGHSSISTTVGIYDSKRDAITNPAASKVSYGG